MGKNEIQTDEGAFTTALLVLRVAAAEGISCVALIAGAKLCLRLAGYFCRRR